MWKATDSVKNLCLKHFFIRANPIPHSSNDLFKSRANRSIQQTNKQKKLETRERTRFSRKITRKINILFTIVKAEADDKQYLICQLISQTLDQEHVW